MWFPNRDFSSHPIIQSPHRHLPKKLFWQRIASGGTLTCDFDQILPLNDTIAIGRLTNDDFVKIRTVSFVTDIEPGRTSAHVIKLRKSIRRTHIRSNRSLILIQMFRFWFYSNAHTKVTQTQVFRMCSLPNTIFCTFDGKSVRHAMVFGK